ncbi:MAG: porin [Bacteroidetes bacterium]|nr:porin [Bacteroidota bacterium]
MKTSGHLFLTISIVLSGLLTTQAQTDSTKNEITTKPVEQSKPAEAKKHWYENISIRGYAQVRYNRFLETNPDLNCEQCDKSWGKGGGLFLRRMRVILYGNVHERVYIYIQPDFASSASTTGLHFGQLRDAYMDLSLDKNKEFRLRFGQSKIPFGFENMQSSQNRLTLDRNDALNSAVANERDLGVFFYWAPKKIRKRFSDLVNDGLKGSGDYGVFAFGIYNGQTANKPEANDNQHMVARLTYPFMFKNGQILEAGIQGYTGNYVVTTLSKNVPMEKAEFLDQRAAASIILYPQPFGFQAEYNIGTGPEYNVDSNMVMQQDLMGGYAMINYMLKIKKQVIFPFVKYQMYDGGKKHELDARSYTVNELEMGIEWQPIKNFEFVAMYTMSERRFEDAVLKDNKQKGNLLRLQAQFNF